MIQSNNQNLDVDHKIKYFYDQDNQLDLEMLNLDIADDVKTLTKDEKIFFKLIKPYFKHSIYSRYDLIKKVNYIQEVVDIYELSKQSSSADNRVNVDHIIPSSYFDFDNLNHLIACCDPRNLRLCTLIENQTKSNKIRECDKYVIDQSDFLSNVYYQLLNCE